MHTLYIKLQQAQHSHMRDDVAEENAELLQHYVVAENDDGTYIYAHAYSGALQGAVSHSVNCISIVDVDGEGQIGTNEDVSVLRSIDGSIWLDSRFEDEVFCN